MGIALFVLVLLVVVVLAVTFAIYNRLVHLRNMAQESWRDIDTELQRRYDLIPNVVNTVKGYAAHEREVFDSVTALRTAAMAETGPARPPGTPRAGARPGRRAAPRGRRTLSRAQGQREATSRCNASWSTPRTASR